MQICIENKNTFDVWCVYWPKKINDDLNPMKTTLCIDLNSRPVLKIWLGINKFRSNEVIKFCNYKFRDGFLIYIYIYNIRIKYSPLQWLIRFKLHLLIKIKQTTHHYAYFGYLIYIFLKIFDYAFSKVTCFMCFWKYIFLFDVGEIVSFKNFFYFKYKIWVFFLLYIYKQILFLN